MGRLSEKTAIITGAGSGFGAGIAKRFAEEGANVVVADINLKRAEDVAAAIGEAAIPVHADVSRKDDIDSLVASAMQRFGRIDIMVNNAGFTHRNMPLTEVSEDNFDLIFAVNMKALYFSTLAVVPIMEGQGGGSIINTASTTALRPREGLTWYNASKGWVLSATKSMALELAPKNIRANCLCPVEGDTEMLKLLLDEDTPQHRAAVKESIPLGQFSTPRDIANAALWLASDGSSFVTGTALEVDGGYSV
ncbi:SDR family NAD(P)-dependent oxidoreductase [Phyllobacterium salinisoli]|uniref:SDR family NAD(P)-dependent oxidoreductase n=1 Tax=Phyllobacterium salinisoli TaxID=1899321 RepID=A0A368K851_9HYPH|nr:SDR family oxidoreductase [Phyllobacterium salinisoli]RCS24653.1 SDR family NAD(P)-dependent oxidoreductase [Phyllobacterium salinisoli]